ncbi:MAG: helix-turn-helix transcriptional regulator [bacterium]|nr:helix-turn-helix transcriptional regulator [bacterium]
MEFDRKKLLRSSVSKLKKLREQLGYSPREMADYLRVDRTAYNKSENGHNFPGLPSLYRLSQDHDISLDWYYFDKGPMCFKDKGKAEELLIKLEELENKNNALETELEEERRKNLELAGEVKAAVKVSPELEDLLAHMAHIPLLHYELMTHFHRFKIENRELLETSMGVTSQEK